MRLAARFGVLERLKCYWWLQLMSTRQARSGRNLLPLDARDAPGTIKVV